MLPPLTRKQRAVLDAIEAFSRENAYMPSVRELAARLDLGVATTHFHLSSLQSKGYLAHDGTAHGLQFPQPAPPQASEESPVREEAGGVRLPVVGVIAAGKPIEAIEFYCDYLTVPSAWVKGTSYILQVRGDSMKDDAILDGDHIVIQKCDTVEDGTIAVALLEDGSATLKRIYKEAGRIRLQPANENLTPVFVDQVSIQGRLSGVLRTV